MTHSKIFKLASMFEKAAQSCVLRPGESTLNMAEAQSAAVNALAAMDQFDDVVLSMYPHDNFVSVIEQLSKGKIPSDNELAAAVAEFSELKNFENLYPYASVLSRINCIQKY
jgi:hypothetical protein